MQAMNRLSEENVLVNQLGKVYHATCSKILFTHPTQADDPNTPPVLICKIRKGQELKVALREMDDYYSGLPEDVKKSGLHKFAGSPPEATAALIAGLWDKYLPDWRAHRAQKKPPDQSKHKELIMRINRIEEEAQSSDPSARISAEETKYVALIRNVTRKKGKWHRFGPEVK